MKQSIKKYGLLILIFSLCGSLNYHQNIVKAVKYFTLDVTKD